MCKALSIDLRERVVAAIAAGASCRAAAARFGVSAASAIRWAALARETGSVAPGPLGGGPAFGTHSVAKPTLSREVRALGYRKLSARPRHRAQTDGAVDLFKRLSPPVWRKSRARRTSPPAP
jgi:transposase-like protein